MSSPDQFEFTARPTMQRIDPSLIVKQPSMSKALALCQTLSGKSDQQFIGAGGVVRDQAQWSRIMSAGQHNFPHDQLNTFMDIAENEAPLLWLLHSRGYDIESLKLRETETERELRIARERIRQLETERSVERRLLSDVMAGRASA